LAEFAPQLCFLRSSIILFIPVPIVVTTLLSVAVPLERFPRIYVYGGLCLSLSQVEIRREETLAAS
jgi:hypothetical protein